MTDREVIKAIEDIKHDKKLHHDFLSGDYRHSLNVAIEALEKQIPKKPKAVDDNIFIDCDDKRYEILSLCPNCDIPFIGCVPKFCSACGQKIDWGDKE